MYFVNMDGGQQLHQENQTNADRDKFTKQQNLFKQKYIVKCCQKFQIPKVNCNFSVLG